ncbi:BES1/BZR1 homolog protein 4-like [Cynara cardunculus var. scolymus]|uniref:BES1/BZR1 homolog protein 4-like n=1 Tax=Cynara cardunculus var. scolymus TaxID=59895 RepID=UPI000D62CF38|nr:BES1/BZR1 homolog protein 4-like [Cynara cardunculus var. scolymus]
MTSGTRMPTWKERENNKRRERRRRAIAAKIFTGLRMYGNYKLPKHCDNNEVLKALADEAGWTVEPDGTTYRKGCKPVERMEVGGSASASPCSSSYHPSPYASYHPSPPCSSIASPSSSYAPNAHPDSLIPWLKNLSSSSSSSNSAKLPHLYIHTTGSISAPVTPPMSSPTARSPPRLKTDTTWGAGAHARAPRHFSYLPSSTPPSPGCHTLPNSEWFSGIRPTSPTFSLVASNPFGFFKEAAISHGGSRMWTPGQSGTCSPAIPPGFDNTADIPMAELVSDEFAFGSNAGGRVKPWEGERIHEVCVSDDLELTLGSSKTR